jgi:hypothetical protein
MFFAQCIAAPPVSGIASLQKRFGIRVASHKVLVSATRLNREQILRSMKSKRTISDASSVELTSVYAKSRHDNNQHEQERPTPPSGPDSTLNNIHLLKKCRGERAVLCRQIHPAATGPA